MVEETALHAQRGQVAMLQAVVRAIDDGRHPRQRRTADPVGQVTGDELRAGQRPIAHAPQRQGPCPRHRPGGGAQTGGHLAGTHALEPHRLVLHQQIEEQARRVAVAADRLRPPGRQAVGVQRHAQALRPPLLVQRRHQLLQVTLEQAHLLHMVEQPLAQRRGLRRRAAHQHRLAEAHFQQLDALRHRRLRQAQALRGALETALLHHRGQGSEQLVVEHIDFPNT
ncbi:hypothetical protein D3C86_1518910 [compost metagenome]